MKRFLNFIKYSLNMRIPDYVTTYYIGEKFSKGLKKYSYFDEYEFYPHLRIRKYCINGMAYVPLIFNLIHDWKKEVTIPFCDIVNRDVGRINSLLYLMNKNGELIKRRERLTNEEREYYETSYFLHKLLRKSRRVKMDKKVGNKIFRIRSLTEEEIFNNASPSFYFIGILYITPVTANRASELSGYHLSTVYNVNSILDLYNYLQKTNGLVFRNKEIGSKFMLEFERMKKRVVKKAEKYIKALELKGKCSNIEISEMLNINPFTLDSWLYRDVKPRGFPIPEPSAKRLQLSKEEFEKWEKYGLTEKEVEKEEFEITLIEV